MSLRSLGERIWPVTWRESRRTRAYLRLDGSQIAADMIGSGPTMDLPDGQRVTGPIPPGPDRSPFDSGDSYGRRQWIGLIVGPLLFTILLLLPSPAGLEPSAQAVAAVTAWVATWWITEAIPIPATSLLPIVLFPVTGALGVAETAPSYAHPVIFLFMGGFFLATAMQRWGLHRRIALRTIGLLGDQPKRIILGFMLATAFLSMWVSNTATVMMMVPIAIAVIYQAATVVDGIDPKTAFARGEFTFGLCLMLAIAYSASVGGVATLIGSPPNIIFAGQVSELFGETITFLEWMVYGVPIAIVGLLTVYLYLTKVALTPEDELRAIGVPDFDERLPDLGAISRPERLVLVVFFAMATGWIGGSLIAQSDHLSLPSQIDSIVAIAGALSLFLIPARNESGERTFLLDWTHAVTIPWGVILLFGGGLAIAVGFAETGLATWIGEQLLILEEVPLVVLFLVVVTVAILLTEITSNTATAAMLLPVLAGIAAGISIHPYALMIAGATAASFAFMLPVATPPNAIVFGTGYVSIRQMAKTGLVLNLLAVLFVTAIVLYWLPIAWGIDITSIPEFAFEVLGDDTGDGIILVRILTST